MTTCSEPCARRPRPEGGAKVELKVADTPIFAYTGARPFDQDKPCIVFVHGAGCDHTVWILQSRYFAHHGYRVLAVDLPGHGASGGEALTSVEAMADWIPALLDAAGVERAAMAGHSMGSLVVLETAARYPERVSALALVASAVPMAVADPLLRAAENNDASAFQMITQWGHSQGAQMGGNTVPGMWMTGGGYRLLERSRPGVLYRGLNACNEYTGGLESAARVRCPSLVLLGREDRMTPERVAARLVEALPGATREVLADCGHMMLSEQPDRVLDSLTLFFSTHE